MPANVLENRIDGCRIRQPVAAIEFPCFAKHARRDVESSLAHVSQRGGKIQQVCSFFVNFDRRSIASINSINDVVGQVAAEFLFDAPRFIGNDLDQLPRK